MRCLGTEATVGTRILRSSRLERARTRPGAPTSSRWRRASRR